MTPPLLFEAEASGDGGARPTVAERGSLGITALEMHCAGGNLLPGVEAIAAAHGPQGMIHGPGVKFGILLELMSNIIDQRGLCDSGKRLMLGFEPVGEMEKIVGVDAKRTRRELAEALSIEESIDPVEFSSFIIEQPIGGGARGDGRLINHGEFHLRPQPQRSSNCLTLSRSPVGSRSAVLHTGGREELERRVSPGSGEEEPF
jgi:hypothetical protein